MKFALGSSLVACGTCALAIVASERTQNQLPRRGESSLRTHLNDCILTCLIMLEITKGRLGNYQLVNCNHQQGSQIGTLLQTLRGKLLPVIQDAKGSGSHRTTAYEFFMKDSSRAQFVADLITNITIGNALVTAEPPFSEGNPTFVCVTKGAIPIELDGTTQDAYAYCTAKKKPAEEIIATYFNPTPWIILCPVFFQLPSYPPIDACPTINSRSNRFNGKHGSIAGLSIVFNQMWVLFNQIVQYYQGAQPGYVKLKGGEVHDINKAYRLSPADALRNAQNYVYYAYSKSLSKAVDHGDWVD